jgi:hypothetical protein
MNRLPAAIVLTSFILGVAAVFCTLIYADYNSTNQIAQACADRGGNFGWTWNNRPKCDMPGNK